MADSVDLAAYGARFTTDPYSVYADLRARGPVHRVRFPPPDDEDDLYLIVGYEEARAALADPRLAKSPATVGVQVAEEEVLGTNLLMADPPQHTRLRKLIAREFTARRVEALRPRIQEITDGLLDEMLAAGDRADLIEALAFPLPITVICELLGVPDMDRAEFRRVSNDVVAPPTMEVWNTALAEMAAYLDELIEAKRAAAPGEDLLGALIRTTAEDGDRLSARELRAMAFLLLVAGHETTVNLIANAVRALLAHPGQLAELRADMSLLDGAVEESLRHEGPVENATHRFTAEPFEVGGTVIPAGSAVIVSLAGADRDPDRFPAPDAFDIHRAPQGHMAFGHGIHFCLGAPLARIEGKVALRSLLERCPDLALDGTPGEWKPGMLMRSMRHLGVRW
ncbi:MULTISPECIES: cytochrome P450 family protein [Streptomyces]|uniref:Cytochrome P450 n=1 Tax=Streptomyces lasiicapitis TaxID=1923961 RepID=A0ABQ2LMN8_9ACTN|nr:MULTISPECIES: cytochrome P450 [Streptomyces]QIB42748.1 cytochrome P450 [Streptomyces aureoverticillatus]GGO39889.1 cytochrome P450 [Streptomyces lasiicapitis]